MPLDRFELPKRRPPRPLSLIGASYGPEVEADAQGHMAAMEAERLARPEINPDLFNSVPVSGPPQIALPYGMEQRPPGAPTLFGPGAETAGMAPADMGAYGGRRNNESAAGGTSKLGSILTLLGDVAGGATAGARQPGFLSGMGAGVMQQRRADSARNPEAQPIDPAAWLKAQADYMRAEAESKYRGAQGDKISRETELLNPKFELEQRQLELDRFAAQSEASRREVQNYYDTVRADLARKLGPMEQRLGEARAEHLLSQAALARTKEHFQRSTIDERIEELASQNALRNAQAKNYDATTGFMGRRVAAAETAADAAMLRAQQGPAGVNPLRQMGYAADIQSKALEYAVEQTGGELMAMRMSSEQDPAKKAAYQQSIEQKMAEFWDMAQRASGSGAMPPAAGAGGSPPSDPLGLR